ncbi:histone [candidate division MSBL1 archaeon SCGC-AAA259I14]|uniref:Histone n=1 Tax=candidate division MSBL1 archaeon SCGC-AAA259I14 TaxID=1698268 RepID=A0A133UT36_9EURY|nr:histone [candidate division MSBL1 archaeon SCGC-AAA259I14]
MGELPVAAVDRIIRRAGGQRVSEGAAVELAEVLEEKGLGIAKEAVKLSEHAGRKTVRDTDVRLALERK